MKAWKKIKIHFNKAIEKSGIPAKICPKIFSSATPKKASHPEAPISCLVLLHATLAVEIRADSPIGV